MNIKRFLKLLRTVGVAWLLFRVKYALKMRGGWFVRKLPRRRWSDLSAKEIFDRNTFAGDLEAYPQQKLARLRPFLFSAQDFPQWKPLFDRWGSAGIDEELENLAGGRFRYFENQYTVCGLPPNWHRNPFSGKTVPCDTHWSRLGDFAFGDIKIIWESSRFGFVFPLIRKYARTSDAACARQFWEIFEDWCEKNPPESGANWKCGQEISLRLMAWCFAFYAFADSPETTRERLVLFVRAVYESARRVLTNLDYALSQKNNHGVSECVGLICAGTLFPELRGSQRWLTTGLDRLEKQIAELVYPDGGFSQHSLNYHRVMLQDLTFALRLMDLNGVAYSPVLRERLSAASDYARDFIFDENTGDTPLWGSNDGAHVFRLTECGYRDFRPHLQCASAGFFKKRYFPQGAWDEETLWFFGKEAAEREGENLAARERFSAKTAGTHILRRGKISAFFRCGKFAHRPGCMDLLHLDLWKNGLCIAGDTGSFSYNSPIPFSHAHNTVTVDGQPQLERLSRFLKLPADSERVTESGFDFAGYHRGYERLSAPVRHARHVAVRENCVRVEDELSSDAEHEYALTWIFPKLRVERGNDLTFRLLDDNAREVGTLQVCVENAQTVEVAVYEGDENTGDGWVAPYYNARVPARTLVLKFRGATAKLTSVFSV